MAKPANKKLRPSPVIYRANAKIGSAAAEDDLDFLQNCFVLTDTARAIVDYQNSQSILLGRTGSGKTACLWNISATEEHVINIEPEEISIGYIANSDIITSLESTCVKLDLFYQ